MERHDDGAERHIAAIHHSIVDVQKLNSKLLWRSGEDNALDSMIA